MVLRSLARIAAALAAVVGLAVGLPAAGAAPDPYDLPGQLLVDAPHGHVWWSHGPTGSGITVAGMRAKTVRTIRLPGATGLAMGVRGREVFVATDPESGGFRGVVGIDAATFRVLGRWPAPAGTCPQGVAMASFALWLTSACPDGAAPDRLLTFDPAHPSRGVVLAGPRYDQFPGDRVYSPGPSSPVVVVYAAAVQPSLVTVVQVAGHRALVGGIADCCAYRLQLGVAPDGSWLVVPAPGDSAPDNSAPSDLGAYATHLFGGIPQPAGVARTSAVVVGDGSLVVTAQRRIGWTRLDGSALGQSVSGRYDVVPGLLAVTPDGSRIFAVSRTASGQALRVAAGPEPARRFTTTVLRMTASARVIDSRSPVVFTGRVTDPLTGRPLAGVPVDLYSWTPGSFMRDYVTTAVSDRHGVVRFRRTPPRTRVWGLHVSGAYARGGALGGAITVTARCPC